MAVERQHSGRCLSSESKRFPNLGSSESAVDDFMKESKEVSEVDPKSAVEAPGVQTAIHQCIVPLDHHEAFALKTIHVAWRLPDTFHHQGQTPGQEASAENRGAEGQIGTRSAARMGSIKQVAHSSLNHQYRQGEQRAHAEPP